MAFNFVLHILGPQVGCAHGPAQRVATFSCVPFKKGDNKLTVGGWGGCRGPVSTRIRFPSVKTESQESDAQKARPQGHSQNTFYFRRKPLPLLGRMHLAERVRIEHTSTRKRADNGFEDREGHQAPITLPTGRH